MAFKSRQKIRSKQPTSKTEEPWNERQNEEWCFYFWLSFPKRCNSEAVITILHINTLNFKTDQLQALCVLLAIHVVAGSRELKVLPNSKEHWEQKTRTLYFYWEPFALLASLPPIVFFVSYLHSDWPPYGRLLWAWWGHAAEVENCSADRQTGNWKLASVFFCFVYLFTCRQRAFLHF